jgi:hypothetical protein
MPATTPLFIAAASAAVLLAAAGCVGDGLAAKDVLPAASVAALEVPPLGLELFRMLASGKPQVAISGLPAQFPAAPSCEQ